MWKLKGKSLLSILQIHALTFRVPVFPFCFRFVCCYETGTWCDQGMKAALSQRDSFCPYCHQW